MRSQKMEESMVYLHNPTQLSHPLFSSMNPTKRRTCRLDQASINISKSKANTVKRHKSNKLDKCTTRTTELAKEDILLQQHQDEIVGDCEIEVQEQGGVWEMASSRSKGSRSIYSKENANALEKSLESLAAQSASSKSTQRDSSASNYEEPETDQLSEPSTGMKKLKLIGELQSYNHQQTFSFEDQNRRTEEPLEFHQSSFATNSVKATSNSLSDPAVMDSHDSMEIVIVNVELSVHTSPQAEHVPFVSLTSEACGITVLGYPLDVREITDSSQTLPPPEGSGDRGTSLNQLGWRTFKRTRTPVCYVTSLLSASFFKNTHAKNVGENDLLMEGKQFNRGETTLNKSCVPVELVFSKILAAVD